MSGVTCFVAVRMGRSCLSVPASAVLEVAPALVLQTHPDSPKQILGLMNHRGLPVPVVCPSVVFDGAASALQVTDHIVVLAAGGRTVALPIAGLVTDPTDVGRCPPLDLGELNAFAGETAVWREEAWLRLQDRLRDASEAGVLMVRARAVCTPKAPPTQHLAGQAHLLLSAGAKQYTLRLDLVWETVLLGPLTQVPGSPPRIAGVCHYRGGILTVVDLPAYLAHQSASVTPQTRALIVGRDAPELALILDGVPSVRQDDFTPADASGRAASLDVQALLDDPALYADRREARQPRES